jgi:hypothetical protein
MLKSGLVLWELQDCLQNGQQAAGYGGGHLAGVKASFKGSEGKGVALCLLTWVKYKRATLNR